MSGSNCQKDHPQVVRSGVVKGWTLTAMVSPDGPPPDLEKANAELDRKNKTISNIQEELDEIEAHSFRVIAEVDAKERHAVSRALLDALRIRIREYERTERTVRARLAAEVRAATQRARRPRLPKSPEGWLNRLRRLYDLPAPQLALEVLWLAFKDRLDTPEGRAMLILRQANTVRCDLFYGDADQAVADAIVLGIFMRDAAYARKWEKDAVAGVRVRRGRASGARQSAETRSANAKDTQAGWQRRADAIWRRSPWFSVMTVARLLENSTNRSRHTIRKFIQKPLEQARPTLPKKPDRLAAFAVNSPDSLLPNARRVAARDSLSGESDEEDENQT